MKPLSSSGTASRSVEDTGDTCNRVCEGNHTPPTCSAGVCSRPSQDSSPVSLPPVPPLLSSTPTHDSTSPTEHVPRGLRRTNPLDHHGRGRGEGGSSCGEGDSSRLSTGAPANSAEDSEEQFSIRNEFSGRAKRTSRCTSGASNLSPHPLSSQQPLQNQQRRFRKRYDWTQAESSFSSSQIGSLLLTSGIATLPAAGICTAGRSCGGHHRRSASGAGGDGTTPPSSRHLQPPTNHSHVNLFVRDLPLELNEEKLRAIFTPFGDIVNSAIMRNIHTGVSLGTAFVRFAKHEEAMQAMEAFADGRPVTGSKRMTVQWARREHDKAPSGDERRKMRKLFIRNVPKDVTQEMLVALFSRYGPVKSVSTHRDTAAANAVSHPGGGSAAAAAEADLTSHGGHDSAAAGVSIDDRRIAFVTFEMEGVAEQATAGVHNTMPFSSCQGIPLMVKLAEDTPVRHNAFNSNNTRGSNIGILSGAGANGNASRLSHNGSIGSGGSVGGQRSAVVASVPNNNALSWSDLPVTDSLSTPMTSPPAVQLHSTTGLAMPPGASHSMPLAWGGAPGAGAGRSSPRAPQDGSLAPALSPQCSFAGTTGSAASLGGTPTYAALSPTRSSSAALPCAGQAVVSAQPSRLPVQIPTALSAPPTSASASTVVPQHLGSSSAVDPMADGSYALASAGLMGPGSGSYNVQGMGSGSTDPIGFLGGDYSGCFLLSSYEAQEFYSRLQQYGSDLAVASGATAQPLLSRQPSASAPGTSTHPYAGSGNNFSSNSASASGSSYQVLASYTDAAQRDGVTSPTLSQAAQPSSTAPLNSVPFQQSALKGLSLPQPRSGPAQRPKQQQQQQPEGGNISSGGHAPTPYRLIPQPRSNAGPNLSLSLSRSAAAAASTASAFAPSFAASRRANTLPPGACPPSSAATSQSRTTRVSLPSASASFTAGGGGANSKNSGTCFCRVASEEGGVSISGVSSLRHGPRATSLSVHCARGGCSGCGGCSFGANGGGAAPGTLAATLSSELATSFARNTTNTFQPYQVTGILGCDSATRHSASSIVDPRDSSTMKYTAAPPAQPASLPLPLGHLPTPQESSRRFFSELKQPVTATVASPAFTIAPLMEAAVKMLSTDDAALTAVDASPLEHGACKSDNMYTAKSDYPASYTAKVMGTASGGDPPLCGENSGTSSSNVKMSNTQSSSDALLGRLASTAPVETASSGGATPAFCRSGYPGEASPHSLSLGGVVLFDDSLLFPWQGTSAAMSGIADINNCANVPTAAAQSPLLCNDAVPSKEPARILDTIFNPSESPTGDLLALADKPKAASVPNMWSQTDAGAYWCAVQMRDPAKLVSRGGGGDTALAVYRTPSTATSTPKDPSHRSSTRTLPGVTAPPPSRISRSDDEDEDERGWIVYPGFNLNLGWPLGPSDKARTSGGVVASGCESTSSHDGVDHFYSQHLGNAMDNLYNLMSYADASY